MGISCPFTSVKFATANLLTLSNHNYFQKGVLGCHVTISVAKCKRSQPVTWESPVLLCQLQSPAEPLNPVQSQLFTARTTIGDGAKLKS